MAWRLAKSLVKLRDEINTMWPGRSKRSDGTLGDPAHASRASRHNPNNAGVVCAIDITHDPAHGLDIHLLARRLVRTPHRDLEYVISNGEVAKRRNGFRWEPYTGSNRHDKHAHFAVGQGPDSEPTPPYDDEFPWGVNALEPDTPVDEEDRMQLYEPDAGPDKGKVFLVGLGDRQHIVGATADETKTRLAECVRQFGPVTKINAVAWWYVTQATALNEEGARSIPPAQEARIVNDIVTALKD